MTNPTEIMNAALRARNMLPMDGHCSCGACERNNLTRDEMGPNGYCKDCLDDASGYASYAPKEGSHQTYAKGVYDYARGKVVFDHG